MHLHVPSDATNAIDATDATVLHPAAGCAAAAPSTRMHPDDERRLVARAATDAEAFGELYDFYLPRIYGFIHRRVLALRFFDDLESAEASAILGCSRRTFAVKLHRAIAALRAALAADAAEILEVSDVA
jgi:hypothetical protein